jgi:predicted secreted protein
MSLVSGLATFLMIWWVVLFMVLPWGVQRAEDTGQIGAPKIPHLRRKFLITTILSCCIWLAVDFVVRSPELSFREKAAVMPLTE